MLKIDIHKKLKAFELHAELEIGQEVLAILGASGAGKSMLLKCLSGLVEPDQGQIIHQNQVLFDAVNKINVPVRKRKIGYLFQNYALFPHMNVFKNISFGMDKHSKVEVAERVNELIKRFRLEGLEHHFPSQLSGGQQQRVALARAMAIAPDILLLDEPLSALDEHLRNHMLEDLQLFLKDYKGSVLYVTHHREEAFRLADRVAIVQRGRIVEQGSKMEIFNQPRHLETAKLTGVKNLMPAKYVGNQRMAINGLKETLRFCGLEESLSCEDASHVGIRPNQIQLGSAEQENSMTAWIESIETTPFRNQVVFKLSRTETVATDLKLIWEPSEAQLAELLMLSQPIHICLPAEQLIVLRQ